MPLGLDLPIHLTYTPQSVSLHCYFIQNQIQCTTYFISYVELNTAIHLNVADVMNAITHHAWWIRSASGAELMLLL